MNCLRVISINVRQPDMNDGANAWECRRDLLLDTLTDHEPDLIGTQELFLLQAEFLQAGAPQYAWFGRGRFGDTRDKHVGIFYLQRMLSLLAEGTFWLSETPEVPGTCSWDIIRPRQVTWGLFESAMGRFYIFNTHFPYRKVEEEARCQAAKLVLRRIASQVNELPVLLTGDFNSPAGGEIHSMLVSGKSTAFVTLGWKRQSGLAQTVL